MSDVYRASREETPVPDSALAVLRLAEQDPSGIDVIAMIRMNMAEEILRIV